MQKAKRNFAVTEHSFAATARNFAVIVHNFAATERNFAATGHNSAKEIERELQRDSQEYGIGPVGGFSWNLVEKRKDFWK